MKAAIRSLFGPRVWSSVRAARVRWQCARFKNRPVSHHYGRVQLSLRLGDPLAAAWYDRDWPEWSAFAVLERHGLRPGARVFDIGAHQCVVALQLAAAVGPQGHVVALEPVPHNYRVARGNIERNRVAIDAGRIDLVCAAGARDDGTIRFSDEPNGFVAKRGGAARTRVVQSRSVDSLAAEFGLPDVVVIDVEGFELDVLRGAAQVLRCRPDLFIEVHVGEGLERFDGSVSAIETVLREAGYARHELLMAADDTSVFAPFDPTSSLTNARFFLLAVGASPT